MKDQRFPAWPATWFFENNKWYQPWFVWTNDVRCRILSKGTIKLIQYGKDAKHGQS